MKILLRHLLKSEAIRFDLKDLHIEDSFLDELMSDEQSALNNYLKTIKLFALHNLLPEEHISLRYLSDLDRFLLASNISKKKENILNNDKIELSKSFLNRLSEAVKEYLKANKITNPKPIKQKAILKFYLNEDGISIKPAALSNQINRNLKAHKYVILENFEEYEILTKTISAFRKMDWANK